MAKRKPGDKWECAACGCKLVGALTIANRVAPIEVKLNPEGNQFLYRRGDTVCVASIGQGAMMEFAKRHGFELRMNHFATCPAADRFREKASVGAES